MKKQVKRQPPIELDPQAAQAGPIVCPGCGRTLKELTRFCPNCATALPQPKENPEHGWWDFYGAAPVTPSTLPREGMRTSGKLRLLAVGILILGIAVGFGLAAFEKVFVWSRGIPFWVGGLAAFAVLLAVAAARGRQEANEKEEP